MRDDVIVRTATAYLELAKVRHSLELMRGEQASGGKILQAIRERVAANQELAHRGYAHAIDAGPHRRAGREVRRPRRLFSRRNSAT